MPVLLRWANRVQGDGIRIYRSASPIDLSNLPTPVAAIGATQTEYTDPGIEGEPYYAVSAYSGALEKAVAFDPLYLAEIPPAPSARLGTPISDRAGLEAMASSSGHFYLTSDIDLSGADWVPIWFYGTFDMNGKTISNMNVTPASYNAGTAGGYAGFFGRTIGATICRGRFLNCSVSTGNSALYKATVGGLFDESVAYDLVLQGCTVATGGARAGTVMGLARGSAMRKVIDCDTTLTGTIGSFCGQMIALVQSGADAIKATSYNYYNSALAGTNVYGTAVSDATLKTAATYDSQVFHSSRWTITEGVFPTINPSLVWTEIGTRAEWEAVLQGAGNVSGLFRLTNNIDFTGSDYDHGGTSLYGSVLDGDGYKISNVRRPVATGYARTGALLNDTNKMTSLENIHVEGYVGETTPEDANYQGPIMGDELGGIMVNCKSSGKIWGNDRVGGFAGFCGGTVFHKCISACEVRTSSRTGAFMGFNWDQGAQYDSSWGGKYNINATAYTLNTSGGFWNQPAIPDALAILANPAATTMSNYTSKQFSTDCWTLEEGFLPELVRAP